MNGERFSETSTPSSLYNLVFTFLQETLNSCELDDLSNSPEIRHASELGLDIIIGGGKYGCHAVEFLKEKNRGFIVVDPDPNCQAVKRFNLKTPEQISPIGEHFILGDLSKTLTLIDTLKPEYVFPTAPVHVAADMAKIKFSLSPLPEAINCILPKLPSIVVLVAGKGKLIVSFNRDKECIEKCSMPEVCPTSRTKKPCTMTKLMRFACPEGFILVSHSMAPGMGALKGSELLEFFSWAEGRSEFVVGTACDCHGVFSAFKKT